jgi:hypothetical protein
VWPRSTATSAKPSTSWHALVPTLQQALKRAAAKAFVILDGTLLSTDRVAADRPFYSGKHRKHGMNVQVLADPFGRLLWVSASSPWVSSGDTPSTAIAVRSASGSSSFSA